MSANAERDPYDEAEPRTVSSLSRPRTRVAPPSTKVYILSNPNQQECPEPPPPIPEGNEAYPQLGTHLPSFAKNIQAFGLSIVQYHIHLIYHRDKNWTTIGRDQFQVSSKVECRVVARI